MAATNYTPIQLYYSTTASAAPTSGNLANGELAINITDGKLYYKDNGGVVQVIATKGAGTIGGSTTQIQYNNAGALAGNAAMTFNSATSTTTLTTLNLTNALGATYGGTAQSAYTQGDILYASATNTLSKLAVGTVNYILTSTGSVPQWVAPTSVTVNTATNLAGGAAGSVPYQSGAATTTFLAIGAADRVMTSSGTAPQWVTALTGLTGVSSSSITNTSITSGRVIYATIGGLETSSANLTFDGTTLSAGGYSTTGLSTLVKTVTIGNSNFSGTAVFAAATPAKLYIGTGTVTDTTSAIGATNATGAVSSLAITPIAATNTSVTYTNASTLYIAGAPSAGTNITITNPYSLYVAGGLSYFGANVSVNTTASTYGLTVGGGLHIVNSASLAAAQGSMVLTFDNPYNRIIMGDGSGYSFALSKRASSTTTDLLTLNDNGTLGLGGAPISTVRQYIRGTGATSASFALYIDDSASSNTFFLRDNGAAYFKSDTGIGTSNNYGARFAVLGGALATSSVGVGISSQLSAGRLTSGDTNSVTGAINNFLDNSIMELSAGSSGIYTSGIVAFGGTAAVNPNTVKTYTAGTVRTTVDSTGLTVVGIAYIAQSTGAGVVQVGTASGRTEYQYLTFGGTTGGTDYGWQVGRSSTAGIVADGFYIYDIKANSTRLAIDLSGNTAVGVVPNTTYSGQRTLSVANYTGTFTALTMGSNATSAGYIGYNMGNTNSANTWQYMSADTGSALYFAGNEMRFMLFPAGSAGATTSGTQAMTLDSGSNLGINETSPATFGKLVVKGGTINLVTDTAAQRRLSFWSQSNGNSQNAYIQVQNDGGTTNTGEIIFATKNVAGTLAERARIYATGLFTATYGSYADPSLASSGSLGLQVQTSATYNDNSLHTLTGYASTSGVIYIRQNGVSAIPFYCNGGGGIAYQWTMLNPQTGAWVTGSGPSISFSDAGASPNTYTVSLGGGGGQIYIQRTGGSAAYGVYIQLIVTS
jgi:hypothetical protein